MGKQGPTDGAHAVVQPARAQAPLRDLKALALAQQHAVLRHAHVLQQQAGVLWPFSVPRDLCHWAVSQDERALATQQQQFRLYKPQQTRQLPGGIGFAV